MADEQRTIYHIPANFIDESRIMRGMFRTRNFIEGLILAVIAGSFAFLIPAATFNTRLTIITAIAGPFFMLGVIGFNGDPLSTTIQSAYSWITSRTNGQGRMVYKTRAILLKDAPLNQVMGREKTKDIIADKIDDYKNKRAQQIEDEVLREDVNFKFKQDTEMMPLYVNRNQFTSSSHSNTKTDEADNDEISIERDISEEKVSEVQYEEISPQNERESEREHIVVNHSNAMTYYELVMDDTISLNDIPYEILEYMRVREEFSRAFNKAYEQERVIEIEH